MKKLKIDLNELEIAFTTDQMSEMEHYLDLQTGEVLLITHEDTSAVEEFFEAETEEEGDINDEFEKWLEEYHCPDWQRDSIRTAFMIEQDGENRFLPIPKEESRDGYNDMVDFTESVTDNQLRKLLEVALNGRGAFRRFKDVLCDYPDERERWFKFSEGRTRERILEWLESEGIELEESSGNGSK